MEKHTLTKWQAERLDYDHLAGKEVEVKMSKRRPNIATDVYADGKRIGGGLDVLDTPNED